GNGVPLPRFRRDTGFCAEDAIEGSVDVAVARMPRDLSWLAGEDSGCAVRDDGAEPFPAGLYHHIGVSSGHELWAKRDRQRSELAQDFWCRVLAHSGIHQHRGPKVSEQWTDVPNVQRDRVVRIERFRNAREIVGTDGMDALKHGMSFEDCVGERHPAPRRRWYRHVMKHDGVAFPEQAMRYRRSNVPNATDEDLHSLRLHRRIVQQWSQTPHAGGGMRHTRR